MKYFVTLKLRQAKLAEVVYANCYTDAESMARANVEDLVDKWDDKITDVSVVSFEDLGSLACIGSDQIKYHNGDYYYFGRKINNDMNFDNGFSKTYNQRNIENGAGSPS